MRDLPNKIKQKKPIGEIIKGKASVFFKKINPSGALSWLYYLYKVKEVSSEVDEASIVFIKNAERFVYNDEKYLSVPTDYERFSINDDKVSVTYNGRSYTLKSININEEDQLTANDGSKLYAVNNLSVGNDDAVNAAIWIKDGLISKYNLNSSKDKAIKTIYTGKIEARNISQVVNPATKKSSIILTIVFFPIAITAGAIKYIGFYLTSFVFNILKGALKLSLYTTFFSVSMPFMFFKKVRDVNKALFFHIIGRDNITMNRINNAESVKYDNSGDYDGSLKYAYTVVLTTKTIENILEFIRNIVVYTFNALSMTLQSIKDASASIIYSDKGGLTVSKSEFIHGFSLLASKIQESAKNISDDFIDFSTAIKGQEINNKTTEQEKNHNSDKYIKVDIKTIFEDNSVIEQAENLIKNGVKQIKNEDSYISNFSATEERIRKNNTEYAR